jgi:hypothetical protein
MKTSSPKGELTGRRGVLFQVLGCQKIIGICEREGRYLIARAPVVKNGRDYSGADVAYTKT